MLVEVALLVLTGRGRVNPVTDQTPPVIRSADAPKVNTTVAVVPVGTSAAKNAVPPLTINKTAVMPLMVTAVGATPVVVV